MSFNLSGGQPTVDVSASAWVSSENDTTATIVVDSSSWMVYSGSWVYSSGVVANVYCDGSWQGPTTIFGNGNNASGTSAFHVYHYFTVNKSSGSRSVYWQTNFHSYIDGKDLGSKDSRSGYVSISGITYYAPNAPSNCKNTRNSDSKNTISWTAPSTSTTKPVNNIVVERSVDGGSWSVIATISGGSTSYADTTCSADHSYKYRVKAKNSAGSSNYSTSGVTYNTPAAPTKLVASRLAETSVKIEITNTSRTATSLDLQRSTNGSNWVDVDVFSGSPVTEATDVPGGGTFYYRARNVRGSLVSNWSPVSDAVVTICPPAAPSLINPASGSVVSLGDSEIVFKWTHNSLDGSAQSAATIEFSSDKGSTWTSVQISGSIQTYSKDNTFSLNDEITWRARTKGVDDEYGPWSATQVFYIRQSPTVSFAQPSSDGAIIENTPVHIELQYNDPSGNLVSAQLTVSDGSNTVYSKNLGTSTSYDILASEWLPDNEKSYIFTINVRSSSTLTAIATRDVTVLYVLPQPALLFINHDEMTGHTFIAMDYDERDTELETPVKTLLYRDYDGNRMFLGESAIKGTSILDKYSPLNVPYQYVAVTFADSGAANTAYFNTTFSTHYSYLYYGSSGIARGMWNPEHSLSIEPTYKRISVAGRKHPIGIMRDNLLEDHSIGMLIMTRDDAKQYRTLMEACEPVIAKLWRGEVFHAIVSSCQFTHEYPEETHWGSISFDLDRIDGDDL